MDNDVLEKMKGRLELCEAYMHENRLVSSDQTETIYSLVCCAVTVDEFGFGGAQDEAGTSKRIQR
jgi:hypothetical protein